MQTAEKRLNRRAESTAVSSSLLFRGALTPRLLHRSRSTMTFILASRALDSVAFPIGSSWEDELSQLQRRYSAAQSEEPEVIVSRSRLDGESYNRLGEKVLGANKWVGVFVGALETEESMRVGREDVSASSDVQDKEFPFERAVFLFDSARRPQ